jgi:hypothetical protein
MHQRANVINLFWHKLTYSILKGRFFHINATKNIGPVWNGIPGENIEGSLTLSVTSNIL